LYQLRIYLNKQISIPCFLRSVSLLEEMAAPRSPPELLDYCRRSKLYRASGHSVTDQTGGIESCPIQSDLLVDPLSPGKQRFVTIITADRLPTRILTAQIGPAQECRALESDPLTESFVQSRGSTRDSESVLTRASIPMKERELEQPLLSPTAIQDQGLFLQKPLPSKPENSTRMENRLRRSATDRRQFFDECGCLKSDIPQLNVTPPPFRKKMTDSAQKNGPTFYVRPRTWKVDAAGCARPPWIEIDTLAF
jgi:hypothetical protein